MANQALNLEALQHVSPYATELRKRNSNLKFLNNDVEREFRRSWRTESLEQVRVALYVGIALITAFGILDYIQIPEPFKNLMAALRLGILLPMVLFAVVINNLERFRSWIFPVAFLMPVFAGICMGTMVMIALQNDFSKPYEGMLVAIFYAFFFCRLLTYEAAFCSFLITLCYLAGLYAVEAPGDIISHHGIYLVTFMIVGIGAAGSLERSIRSTFLTSRLINEFAERDSLTGLNNRHYFDHAYKELIRTANKNGKSIGVMMMDIDHFKAVNDGEGHQAGDNVIRKTGKGLAQGCLRKPALLARYGGDEFVAVWVGNSKADIESSIESMRKHCADLNKGVTTSAGLAWLYPPADPEFILEEADKALYGAKENGRNQLFSSATDKATNQD